MYVYIIHGQLSKENFKLLKMYLSFPISVITNIVICKMLLTI